MRGTLVLLALLPALVLAGCAGSQPEANQTAQCLDSCNASGKVCGADGNTYESGCHALCMGVQSAYAGPCGQCQDSDGGKNRSQKGTVTTASSRQTDYCAGFYSVEEYYCQNGLMGRETIQCEAYEECRDGACGAPPPKEPAPECIDNDGTDIYTKGVVNGSGALYQDSCEDHKRVREFYCDGGLVRHRISECAAGYECEAGRCLKTAGNCTDTDSGDDIYAEGKIILQQNLVVAEYLDKCIDGDTVREYYCVYGDYVVEDRDCPGGFRCVQAACKEDLCTDSDEGYSIFRKGGVNKGDVLEKDYCTGPDGGVEYYCDENAIVNSTFTCPAGYSCTDGRCY